MKTPIDQRSASWCGLAVGAVTLVLAGCAARPNLAPVEDRTPPRGDAMPTSAAASAPAPSPGAAVAIAVPADGAGARPLPGAENAGKPGYYTVKPGDTLIRIGLETGQNWRDIARWSGLDNANRLEVGQVLRVTPPAAEAAAAVTRPVAAGARVESRPLDGRATVPSTSGASATPGTAAALPPPGAAPAPTAEPGVPSDEDVNWAWPANGNVIAGFDESRHKGLTIAGKAGDPVLAAADGRVVYAGSGLRGYGNLVIVKHNNTYLSAYAHNQLLLVKEDQVVRRGQKIAEMGSSDAERVQLHFEVRRQGKPIDPARLLPPR